MLSGEMWTEREFALAEYLPFMLVGFYPLFQERGRPKLERPKATWDVRHSLTSHLPIPSVLIATRRAAPCGDHHKRGDIRITLAVLAFCGCTTSRRLQTPCRRSSSPARSGPVFEPHHLPPAEPCASPF